MANAKLVRMLWNEKGIKLKTWPYILQKRLLHNTVGLQCITERGPYVTGRLSEEEKEKVAADGQALLNFFNYCDYVTLKKLIGRSYTFRSIVPDDLMRRGIVSKRFRDLQDLIKYVPSLKKPHRLVQAAKETVNLKEDEENDLGIRHLVPPLTYEEMKDVDQVTAVEVFQNEIAWAVETRDRAVITTGHTILFPKFKYTYEHISYQERLSKVISRIPESPLYLMCPPNPGRGDKYVQHQSIMLTLAVLMLNLKAVSKDLSDSLDAVEGDIPNKVHMMKLYAVQEFYDIKFKEELLNHAWDFNHWSYATTRPFSGMQWNKITEDTLTKAVGRKQMTKCVMVADMFFKCLHKSVDNFPRMYSER